MIRNLLLAAALLPVVAAAAPGYERPVTPLARGAARLDVDVQLLSAARDRLVDLRFYDSRGVEVPYLLVQRDSGSASWLNAAILPLRTTKTTSGFEADFKRSSPISRISIEGLGAPFMKRATIEGSGDRTRWTLLAESTVFDLPDQRLRMTEVAFTPGSYRYVRVTWDDRSSARVAAPSEVRARVESAGKLEPPLTAPLTFRKVASEPGRSRYAISIPAWKARIEAIELDVENEHVSRQARITESRLDGGRAVPVVLGSTALRRIAGEAASTSLAIAISAPEGRELELVVEDENNAPLQMRAVKARFPRQPWIYFESDGSAIVARYGDASLEAPRYDLEAVRSRLRRDATPLAQWQPPVATADAGKREATVAPAEYGAVVDPAKFDVKRVIDQAAPGLAALPLDLDVLARSRSFNDVRIVDSANRQIPYVLEQRDAPLVATLPLTRASGAGARQSIYVLQLPYATLPPARITLATDARVFERGVVLRRPPDEKNGRPAAMLGRATWAAARPEIAAERLTFEIPLTGSSALEVLVDEGDNAPLPIRSAELLLPSYALRFNHPGGDLFLLYGNRTVPAPRYDLALLAPRILREPAVHVAASAAIAALPPSESRERTLFWIVIAAAAVVLGGVFVRVLRSASA